MSMTTGSISRALLPNVNFWVGLSYNEIAAQYSKVYKTIKSELNFEELVSAYGLGLAVAKPEGEAVSYDTMAQGFQKFVGHTVYGIGFVISEEAVDDNKYPQLAEMKSRQIGLSLRQTKENVAMQPFNRAFNGSYVGADGLELCSTAHLLAKGGTFKNELSTAADLSEASLEQAVLDIMDFKNDAGLKIEIMPEKLFIPKELQFEAKRILGSDKQVHSAEHNINALNAMGCFPGGVVVNRYLSDTDAWFILTNAENGFMHFQRKALEVKNESDFDNGNLKYKGQERYSFTYGDPRCVFGSPGA